MSAPIVKCITKEARERDGFSSFKEWCDTPNHIYIGPNIRKYLKDYSKKDSLWCNPFRNYDLTPQLYQIFKPLRKNFFAF